MANGDLDLIRVERADEDVIEMENDSPWNILRRVFPDRSLEKLYQLYRTKQKRDGMQCFLVASLLYNIYHLAVPSDIVDFDWPGLFFLVTNFLLLLWCMLDFKESKSLWKAIPHVAWAVFIIQILVSMFFKTLDVTGNEHLGWIVLLDYLIYVLLPFRMRQCIVLSVVICISYTITVATFAVKEWHLLLQLCANVIVLIASNVLGLTTHFLSDKQQRQAFLETRQSLEMKMLIEEQSAEQERLLLSVLPEHVAVRMRQDLGSALDSQFKKIYMSRHENVSILYADIVGFTAISSTYSASELVKILNELFARFDRLSEKYKQLRIKILGDCYYCISGAPKERADHAVLCVHMGLSMVKAIKYVQQTCNSPVDMRVGIHTGAVLAGVLGQRQWQFDVYSKDVELANKMESSGKPGRVHISDKTLSFLNGEFEVEPAYGEKREEALRLAGIKTYFIVKVLKPFKDDLFDDSDSEDETGSHTTDLCNSESRSYQSPEEDESQKLTEVQESPEDIQQRLSEELVNKGALSTLSDYVKCFTLAFKSLKKERDFTRSKEIAATVSILGLPFILLFISIAQFIVLPRDSLSISSFTLGLVVLTFFSVIAIAELKPSIFPDVIVRCSEATNDSLWARRTLAAVAIFISGCINAVDMISCNPTSTINFTLATSSTAYLNCSMYEDIGTECVYPSYFSYFCVLILVAASLPTQISHLVKIAILFFIVAIHCTMNLFVIPDSLDCELEFLNSKNLTSNKYAMSSMLFCIAIALSFLARHMEKATRVLFLWKTEVEEQKEKARDMASRNEALVYNILPPHVACHFLGNRNRQHEELYSQSYAEVGVLFASMPNFSDFYSEESVNNQGLECLRFLNEVISDFDAILQLPKYQDIIKIKTIGSTYMAASGLNPSRKVKPDDPIHVRWAHLALLVEFAFDMKKALQGINEQSFNHFVLKMGINHGPITAGVIGARKPHYDIWGNSVNVASRMESTGKAGCIQVTEETCEILQHYGYVFEQRGLVAVKGKGQLMTYYLIGKSDATPQFTVTPTIEKYPDDADDDEEQEETKQKVETSAKGQPTAEDAGAEKVDLTQKEQSSAGGASPEKVEMMEKDQPTIEGAIPEDAILEDTV